LRTIQSGGRILVPQCKTRPTWGTIAPLLQITASLGAAYLTTNLIILSRREF
jgi:hypothetical protein